MKIFSPSPLFLLLTPSSSQDQDRFAARSTPPATHILAERYLSTLSYNAPLTITSDVPVTLQRYSDTSTSFLMGQEPVPPNYGMVVVTSDCNTDATTLLPEISVSENGDAILVSVGVSEEEGASMSFLQETTRYSAFWSYVFGFCGFGFIGTSSSAVNVANASASTAENATFAAGAAAFDLNAYKDCAFECCAHSDCTAGCCIEGRCRSNPAIDFELCVDPPPSPPDGVVCGAAAYKNFQADGNCPGRGATTTTTMTTTTMTTTMTTTFSTFATTVDAANASDVSTTTAAAIATTDDGNPCLQGMCPDPDGQCAAVVMCFVDPCQINNGGCAEIEECISNYCGGCNAVCVGGTASGIVTTPAATTTVVATGASSTPSPSISGALASENLTSPPTANNDTYPPTANSETYPPTPTSQTLSLAAINETSSPTANNTPANGKTCAPGKCFNLAGECAREVVCTTPPCDIIQCAPYQECVANLCGDCVAVCVGRETAAPTPVPSPESTPFPSETPATPAPVASPTVPKPVSAVDETDASGLAGSDQSPNPPTASIFQGPTTVQPIPNNPTSPVVIIVNVPSQTVVVPAPSDNGPASVDEPAENAGSTENAPSPTAVVPAPSDNGPAPVDEPAENAGSTENAPSPTAVVPAPSDNGPAPVDEPVENAGSTENAPSPTAVVPAPSDNGPAPVDEPVENAGSTENAPSPTAVVPAPSDNRPASGSNDTAATDTTALALGPGASSSPMSSDVLDAYENVSNADVLDTLSPTSNVGDGTTRPSVAPTPSPTAGDNTTGTNSPAPSDGAVGDRGFIGAIQEASASSGFTTRYSFNIRMAVSLMAVLVAAFVVPGREGAAHGLWGFGKLFVAAVAVSSLFSRSEKNGNVRRNSKETSSRVFPMRNLQGTCTYNVEILYDGCTKSVEVNAPAARVIDVVMEDYTSETNAEDECQTDYTANLTFPLTNSTVVVDLSSNNTVAAYDYSDWQCQRAIEGRPFIDASGKGIQALPMLSKSCVDELTVAWSGEVSVDSSETVSRNATHHNQVMLGNEWTQRALGEHASIASFSAFSIALMTNHAPSTLVEDALKAGLDEVRHARTSFEIASRLLGRNVEPRSLPESKHEFGQDLTALALAVAREGCVDETLSAFAAAAEVDAIHKFMEDGVDSSKYSNVDRDVLRWISDELRTIAQEESYHSALAWRTLKWVCSVDSEACSAVQREVFDASKLEMRFLQRSEGNASFSSLMKKEWERIHDAHKLSSSPAEPSFCASTVQYSLNEPLISTLTEIVLQAIVCAK